MQFWSILLTFVLADWRVALATQAKRRLEQATRPAHLAIRVLLLGHGSLRENFSSRPVGNWKDSNDSSHSIRSLCRYKHAGHLCAGEPQLVVHPGIRLLVPAGVGIRLSAGSLAVWSGGGDLGGGGGSAVVSGSKGF